MGVKYTDEQLDKFIEDNYQLVYEKLEQEVPDVVGAYYYREGTHHCDFIADNIDYVVDFIQKYLAEELDVYTKANK